MSTEKAYPSEKPEQIFDWACYAGVKMPRYLITQESFEKKLNESSRILDEVKTEMEKGTSSEDAGDTHGQYHNEYEWYRQQSLEMKNYIGTRIGQNLNWSIIISGYEEVRTNLQETGVDPGKIATMSSKVGVLYPDETEPEEIVLVSLLDGNQNPGWVSVESPLGTALLGHIEGETVSYKLNQRNAPPTEIKVKIATIG